MAPRCHRLSGGGLRAGSGSRASRAWRTQEPSTTIRSTSSSDSPPRPSDGAGILDTGDYLGETPIVPHCNEIEWLLLVQRLVRLAEPHRDVLFRHHMHEPVNDCRQLRDPLRPPAAGP